MEPNEIKHVTQKVNHELHGSRVGQITELLLENPPGTFHSPAEQWPTIRPVLEYFRDAIEGQNNWRDALTDFMSVSDVAFAQEEENPVINATEPPPAAPRKRNRRK